MGFKTALGGIRLIRASNMIVLAETPTPPPPTIAESILIFNALLCPLTFGQNSFLSKMSLAVSNPVNTLKDQGPEIQPVIRMIATTLTQY